MRLPLTSIVMIVSLCGCAPAPAPVHASEANAAPAVPAPDTPFAYAETDIVDLQAQMTAGALDSVTLTRAYLERIARIDRAGPRLKDRKSVV